MKNINNKNQYVYCMKTIITGLVKIGKTKNFENRMKLLEGNGYRNLTGLERYFAIKVNNNKEVEEKIQNHFKNKQVGNTELYACNINDVVSKMLEYGEKYYSKIGDTTEEINEYVRENKGITNVKPDIYYYPNKKKEIAKIIINKNYEIILCKGSEIEESKTNSLKHRSLKEWERIRKGFVKNNKLTEDYKCSSISLAISVVKGTPVDGWNAWVSKDNKPISQYKTNKWVQEEEED